MAIRFEFSEGTANKFWTINLEGSSYTVHFGRIGTAGQVQNKSFANEAQAKAAYDKLIAEKTKKGYVQTGDATMPANPQPSVQPAVSQQPATVKKSAPVALQEKPESTDDEDEPLDMPVNEIAHEVSDKFSAVANQHNQPVHHSEMKIRLEEIDWQWASWKPRLRLAKPTPRPFDLKALLKELETFKFDLTSWMAKWKKANVLPFHVSRQEAEFWLSACLMATFDREIAKWTPGLTPAEQEARKKQMMIEKLAKMDFTGDRDVAWLQKHGEYALTSVWYMRRSPMGLAVLAMMPVERLLDTMLAFDTDGQCQLMMWFRSYVLPYLSEGEIQKLKSDCLAKMKPGLPGPHLLAAALAMTDEVRQLIDSMGQSGVVFPWTVTALSHMILSLSSSEEIEENARRWKIHLEDHSYAKALLATTELRMLDVVADASMSEYPPEKAADIFSVLCLAEAPDTVRQMLRIYVESKKLSGKAREWMERFPDWTVKELIRIPANRGALSEGAKGLLSDLSRKAEDFGLEPELMQALGDAGTFPEEKLPVLTVDQYPNWLDSALNAMKVTKKSKLPLWADSRAVPPLVIDGKRLSHQDMEFVISALQQSGWDHLHPLVQKLQHHLGRRATEKLAWNLFQRWLREGAPSKEKWALMSIGFFGGDECALKITPMIKVWPGESQHQRAVTGLECLRHIGSDTALMQINGIAQKLKFQGLKSKAMECMEQIAVDKGLSREQLEDRIVPDCGLDEKGSRLFDLGSRSFHFVLSPELKPLLKDEDGKVKSDLPKTTAKDDPDKAIRATDDWKMLKQQIKEVAKIQANRLEHTMVVGRRWTYDEFDSLLVKHPLMVNLVRRLIWAGYDDARKLIMTFRVTEDQTFADENDRDVDTSAVRHVAIIHPAHLTDEQKARWGEVLSDYEIISPFEQLGRTVMGLELSEMQGKVITRFAKKVLPAVTIVGALEKNGWQRGVAADAGMFSEHVKQFHGANITAVVLYPGIGMQWIMESDDQPVEECFFLKGIEAPTHYRDSKAALPLKDVDPVVVSEVLRILSALTAKAEEK